MVPKLFKAGKSFKGLTVYLLHDAGKKQTSERVSWTHTLNLASDDPGLAVDEMLWAYRYADELKRQAGIKAGGRRLENPVKHFSLNWHPTEDPSREHMIETVESFLAHMGWQDHHALIVRHVDKEHPHVHVVLNAVHPETGLALNSSFEHRRAQTWARTYEREHGLFCEERLKPASEREESTTRDNWQRVKGTMREHERAEIDRVAADFDYFTRNEPGAMQDREWAVLKDHQRQEREQFFINGKKEYREARNVAFREVRAEFRPVWREYFQAKRDGMDADGLKGMKEVILADQKAMLDQRVKDAFADLRDRRDMRYDAMKERQGEERDALRHWQEEGRRAYDVLDQAYPNPSHWAPFLKDEPALDAGGPARAGDAPTGMEQHREQPVADDGHTEPSGGQDHLKVRDGLDVAGSLIGAVAKIGERLFDGFFGGGETPAPKSPPPPDKGPMLPEEDREKARRAAEEQAKREASETEAQKLYEQWQQWRERRRERD